MQITLDHSNATHLAHPNVRHTTWSPPPPGSFSIEGGKGCSTQLPTRTYQTWQTLLLHLPEPSMSFTL